MTKKSALGTLLCVVFLTTTVALSAAADRPSRFVHTTRSGKVTRAVQTPAPYTIFSNLGKDPTNLYNCCNGYIISGINSTFGYSYAEAIAFTPKHNAKIKTVEAGMSWYGYGANQVDISVYSDSSGVPGTLLATGTATNLQTFGQCCALATITVKPAVAVVKGTQYWIVGDTPGSGTGSDSVDVWNVAHGSNVGSNYDSSGWSAYDFGNGYALAVLGRLTK
jgi:hypothetical protein